MISNLVAAVVLATIAVVCGRELVRQLRDERDWSGIYERERAARALRKGRP